MALNSGYVIASGLQELLVDKVTGLPLAGGIVTFYKDQARTILKPIYELVGSPFGYSYDELPNPLTLSSVGTIQDINGNDVVPYYHPYDADGNIELYYITVVSAGGVPQWTRQAWPNTFSASESIEFENFIPNGQFLIHEITPATDTTVLGQITQDITSIAQGGWVYQRSADSGAVDIITFPAFGAPISNPTGNPKYALRFACTTPDTSDVFKYIGISFNDVNKFSSLEASPQYYTFSFSGKTNGASVNVDLVLSRFFGVGGSTPNPLNQVLNTVTLTNSYQTFYGTFTYDNTNKTVTTGDAVSLFVSPPATYAVDISITDFVLVIGENAKVPQFPLEPDYIFQNQSMVPAVPDPMGNDLYLPLVLTKTGLAYDHSEVGKIYYIGYAVPNPNSNELACDGSAYYNADYSSLGIPYARLGSVLYDSTIHLPNYGTGSTFVTSLAESVTGSFTISTNTPAETTAATDGVVSTGFKFNSSFGKTVEGSAISYGFYGLAQTGTFASSFLALTAIVGVAHGTTSAGNTGWTYSALREGSATLAQLALWTVTTHGTGLAGQYILLSNTTTNYYIWYKVVDAVTPGTDPLIAGATGIEVDILTASSTADIARLTAQAISTFSVDRIVTIQASDMDEGCYFSLYNSTDVQHVYWYQIAGHGSAPVVAGAKIYQITLAGTETAAVIATMTIDAINRTCYGVPDFRGAFLRVWNNGSNEDPDALSRYSLNNAPAGDHLGSYELDQILSHNHAIVGFQSPGVVFRGGTDIGDFPNIAPSGFTGGSENRVANYYVNAVIKY